MNSIRVRLLFSICLCLFGAFVIAGISLYGYVHHFLMSSFDERLFTKAEAFARTTEQQENGAFDFEFLESNLPEFAPHSTGGYYEVWRKSGEVLVRSPSLDNADLPVEDVSENSPLCGDIVLPDGRQGRAVALTFLPQAGDKNPRQVEKLTMVLAAPRRELDMALSRVIEGLSIAGLALILCAFPAVWWAVRRHLSSLSFIAEQANAIEADHLSFRFSVDSLPIELLPICGRLNSLLQRLEEAFNRERRFTADAAHELRTPIAELRTLADVGLAEASDSAPSMREYFEDALDIARHLENLVTTLLSLTRCEAGQQLVDIQTVDATSVIRDLWMVHEAQARDRGISTMVDLEEDVLIGTDLGLFKAMLANLLANAVSYTPTGGQIHLALQRNAGSVVMTLANTNRNLQAEDMNHLFEPFWRKQEDLTDMPHCGVGLPLVAAYAKLLGVTVNAEIPSDGLFQIALCLPFSRLTAQSASPFRNPPVTLGPA